MNFIFISPQFPTNYWHFCEELKHNGVNVLGIGDSEYDSLSYNLRSVLTEYYKVDTMENYDQMMRAVAYFTFKYGKIDWIESNNEYWLNQDASLRTDFNIATGYGRDEMKKLRSKSKMKQFYKKAGVPTVACHKVGTLSGCLSFTAKHGYPVVIKPDSGVGASDTYSVKSDDELKTWLKKHGELKDMIMEPYIDGTICSYDAIINSKGEPIFESGNVTPLPVMDIVNKKLDSYFYIEKNLQDDVRDSGRRCVKAFGVRSRFVHLEFFRLNKDMDELGSKGDIVGLEANLRPSGGFTPDMLNFANSTNVYKIWADMIAFDKSTIPDEHEHFYCIFVGRRDCNEHIHAHNEILSKFRQNITMSDRMPKVLSSAMGDQMYIAKFSEYDQMEEFLEFVTA